MALEKRPTRATADADATDSSTNIRHIKSGGHHGNRQTSAGYDPSTGIETNPKGYRSTATRESTAEHDMFAVVDHHSYSEDRFYTRSVNADGHGEKLQVRVPQGIDSQMHGAVAEVPEYRTMQDLVRDAVMHRLEYLQKRYNLGDGARRILELDRIRSDSEARAQEVEVLSATVVDLDTKLALCFAAEDWQMMALELEEGEDRAEWLRDPYKSKAEDIINSWREKAKKQLMKRRADQERDREDR